MKETHVYVFGAGASAAKPISAPVMRDFLDRGFNDLVSVALLESQGEPEQISAKASFWRVAEMLDRLYACRLVEEINACIRKSLDWARQDNCVCIAGVRLLHRIPHGATIEELLAFTELDGADGQWREYRQPLQDFVFATLEKALISRSSHNCYTHFVQTRVDRKQQNVFLSFNYDDLLDEALWDAGLPMPSDYSLPFVHVERWRQYDDMLRCINGGKQADLLKLHGSLNWARCKRCGGLHLFSFQQYLAVFQEPCRCCKTSEASLRPVLVPPTLHKNIKGHGIDMLWEKAEEALARADRISIIGYSFPDADLEAKWLFKRAIAKGGKMPSLTIVDPCERVQRKIVEFFGNTVRDTVLVKNFETYVGDPSTSPPCRASTG